jgi:hypothetical protein
VQADCSSRWNCDQESVVESPPWPESSNRLNLAIALAADLELEGAWRVEWFDSDGAGYITIFAGQSAEERARDYYDAIERGTLNTRIFDAQVVTPKKVVSFQQKRRRPLR